MSNNPKRSALGRGLSALLENSETDITSKPTSTGAANGGAMSGVAELPLDQIEPNPFQPRTEFPKEELKELADSIREQGIIQPITVRKMGYDKYQIISGERRFRASKLAGRTSVPAYVRVANDQAMLEMALVENIQRQELNPLDIAISYKRLVDECGLTQEQLSDRVGKERSTVTNFMRLLKLPPEIQAALRDNRITMGHARALLGIRDIDEQLMVYKAILEKELTVREVETLAGHSKPQNTAKRKPASGKDKLSASMEDIRKRLSDLLEARVQLSARPNGSGTITIPFSDTQDLNRILDHLDL
ncbi:MAG: hypothetical protein RL021_1422 [Bacteroidota bacterium]|jgi:ParB family chromosome partitioning protein